MEKFHFLLKDVTIEQRQVFPKVDPVLYKAPGLEANERQFFLSVPDLADFYSENGTCVYLNCKEPLQKNTIELFLNGSVLGSILHQRSVLTLHASSFQLEEKNIVICGHSGFGKSALTLSMCLNHRAQFLTDDLTPLPNGNILPISERMKLWQDTLDQLGVRHESLSEVWKGMEKYYLPMSNDREIVKPDCILFGQFGEKFECTLLHGAEKFRYVLSFQYWEELSNSMEDSRKQLFSKITDLCNGTPMYVFTRPEESSVEQSTEWLFQFFTSLE